MSESFTNKKYITGIIAGIVGVIIGALIWKYIAIYTGYMSGFVAIISAAIAGGIFGYMTQGGNKNIRSIVGATLGIASIIMGYYFIYISPIDLGYPYFTVVLADEMSFEEFMSNSIEAVDMIFLFIGLYEGAKLGSIETGSD